MALEKMSFCGFFYFKLWRPFCSAEQNHLSMFGRGSSKYHFREIILKSADWPWRRCHFTPFSFFSSDSHFVQRSRTILDFRHKFLKLASGEHLYEIILKSTHWPWWRCCSWVFLFLALTAVCSAEQNHFSKTGRRSSKEHSGEIILKLVHWPKRRCHLKGFSIFSSDGHFVQWSGTILAILVEGHPKNISTKLC